MAPIRSVSPPSGGGFISESRFNRPFGEWVKEFLGLSRFRFVARKRLLEEFNAKYSWKDVWSLVEGKGLDDELRKLLSSTRPAVLIQLLLESPAGPKVLASAVPVAAAEHLGIALRSEKAVKNAVLSRRGWSQWFLGLGSSGAPLLRAWGPGYVAFLALCRKDVGHREELFRLMKMRPIWVSDLSVFVSVFENDVPADPHLLENDSLMRRSAEKRDEEVLAYFRALSGHKVVEFASRWGEVPVEFRLKDLSVIPRGFGQSARLFFESMNRRACVALLENVVRRKQVVQFFRACAPDAQEYVLRVAPESFRLLVKAQA